jgi:hypothetical protein
MEYARMQQDLKDQQMKIIHEQKQIEAENRSKKSSAKTSHIENMEDSK